MANTSKTLLDASDQGFPGTLVDVSAQQAVVGFVYPTYKAFMWNPTLSNLGSELPGAPQAFDYDGHGNQHLRRTTLACQAVPASPTFPS